MIGWMSLLAVGLQLCRGEESESETGSPIYMAELTKVIEFLHSLYTLKVLKSAPGPEWLGSRIGAFLPLIYLSTGMLLSLRHIKNRKSLEVKVVKTTTLLCSLLSLALLLCLDTSKLSIFEVLLVCLMGTLQMVLPVCITGLPSAGRASKKAGLMHWPLWCTFAVVALTAAITYFTMIPLAAAAYVSVPFLVREALRLVAAALDCKKTLPKKVRLAVVVLSSVFVLSLVITGFSVYGSMQKIFDRKEPQVVVVKVESPPPVCEEPPRPIDVINGPWIRWSYDMVKARLRSAATFKHIPE